MHPIQKKSYCIFICDEDVFKKGEPIYTIERIARPIDKYIEDGNYIVYVNGQYKGEDEKKRLEMLKENIITLSNKLEISLLNAMDLLDVSLDDQAKILKMM